MYDAEWNLITPNSDVIDTDEEEIDTPDGHQEEDQDDDEVVTISKSEFDRLKKQNEKLKTNKIKNIVKHKSQWSELAEKVKALEEKLTAKERQEQESEIKSLYADANLEEVNDLISKGLSAKQAVNALYADKLTQKPAPSWFVWRSAPANTVTKYPAGYEYRTPGAQNERKTKNWL